MKNEQIKVENLSFLQSHSDAGAAFYVPGEVPRKVKYEIEINKTKKGEVRAGVGR